MVFCYSGNRMAKQLCCQNSGAACPYTVCRWS